MHTRDASFCSVYRFQIGSVFISIYKPHSSRRSVWKTASISKPNVRIWFDFWVHCWTLLYAKALSGRKCFLHWGIELGWHIAFKFEAVGHRHVVLVHVNRQQMMWQQQVLSKFLYISGRLVAGITPFLGWREDAIVDVALAFIRTEVSLWSFQVTVCLCHRCSHSELAFMRHKNTHILPHMRKTTYTAKYVNIHTRVVP